MNNLSKVKERFDRQAIHQMRTEIENLAKLVDQLKAENKHWQECCLDAQEWADQCHDDFMYLQLRDYPDFSPAITKSGRLTIVKNQ